MCVCVCVCVVDGWEYCPRFSFRYIVNLRTMLFSAFMSSVHDSEVSAKIVFIILLPFSCFFWFVLVNDPCDYHVIVSVYASRIGQHCWEFYLALPWGKTVR